jgi:hypothetical protein
VPSLSLTRLSVSHCFPIAKGNVLELGRAGEPRTVHALSGPILNFFSPPLMMGMGLTVGH